MHKATQRVYVTKELQKSLNILKITLNKATVSDVIQYLIDNADEPK